MLSAASCGGAGFSVTALITTLVYAVQFALHLILRLTLVAAGCAICVQMSLVTVGDEEPPEVYENSSQIMSVYLIRQRPLSRPALLSETSKGITSHRQRPRTNKGLFSYSRSWLCTPVVACATAIASYNGNYMERTPRFERLASQTDTYIDNIFINTIMSSIRDGTDSLDLYNDLAGELLRQVDARELAEKRQFLGQALMTLVHTALKRRRVGGPLTG